MDKENILFFFFNKQLHSGNEVLGVFLSGEFAKFEHVFFETKKNIVSKCWKELLF